jgi:hypothetical protein
MVLRTLLIALLVGVTVVTLSDGWPLVRPAEAEGQIGPISFSTDIDGQNRPTGQVGIEFDSDNNGVAVSFDYFNMPPGTSLTRIVRADGQDYNWDSDTYGHLPCCNNGGSGRLAFWVVKRSGERGQLPGAAYQVLIYANGNEVARAGFGVKGDEGNVFGGDNNHNGNGNDNN